MARNWSWRANSQGSWDFLDPAAGLHQTDLCRSCGIRHRNCRNGADRRLTLPSPTGAIFALKIPYAIAVAPKGANNHFRKRGIGSVSGVYVMTTATATVESSAWYWNRWSQLVLGLIAMMAISSPQYVWTLFTGPLNQKMGTTLAELQWTFSLLIILQTWCSPLQAYLVDRFGPRLLISVGALMSGGGWVLSSYVDNIWALYFTYGVICGFGTGIIYVGIIGLMVRWFPDRRGLATGLAAAGYGFGAIFTSFPIDSMIKASGYAHTLVVWGIIQGAIGVLAAQGLRLPPESWRPEGYSPSAATTMQSKRSFTPVEML